MYDDKNKKLATISVLILIPLFVGYIANYLTKDAMYTYQALNKSSISPPAYIFPIVWTILYVLMGISSYFVYTSDSYYREKAFKIYVVQLILNFGWSIIFFGFNMYLLAFIWLLLLIVTIIYMIIIFFKINKISAYLLIPYLLWCVFAAYLNLSVVLLN